MENELRKFLRSKRDDHLDFLRDLIRRDTQVIGHGIEGGNEENGQVLIEARLKKAGFATERIRPSDAVISQWTDATGNLGHNYDGRDNVVGVLRGTGGGRSLILNGHVDTMPPGSVEQWTYDPFEAEVVDGRVYGLGSVDMKGGLAANILAIESLLEFGVELKGDVIIQSVVDEEGGGNGTLVCCAKGYRADAAIVSEPTGLTLRTAGRGFLYFSVTVQGRALHAGAKWDGVSAIDKAIKLIRALEELEHRWMMTRRHTLLPPPTLNVGQISGGTAGSVVPGTCTFKFGAHYLPTDVEAGDGGRKIEREIIDALMTAAQGDPWLRDHPPVITKYQEGTPFDTPVDHPLVRDLGEVIEQVSGMATPMGHPFGTDARHLQEIAQTPVVVFGPGDPNLCHTIDEHLDLDQFYRGIEVLALFAARWCNAKPQ